MSQSKIRLLPKFSPLLFLSRQALIVLLLLPVSLVSAADEVAPAFDDWLVGIRQQALAAGISPATVEMALSDLEPDPRVLKFDRKQPEFVQTFEQYLSKRVTPGRIKIARRHFEENKSSLQTIGAQYGIDPQYLVAFWGLESSFGRYQGKYSVVRSLATLAHDPRRTTFFTKELMSALKILDEGHVPPDEFVGGWAGAMGQNQFMPSSFLNFAQDFDGDGKKNIWTNQLDVWASIAFYLQESKWQVGQPWGLEVRVNEDVDFAGLMPTESPSGCRAVRGHTRQQSLEQWAALGVMPINALSSTDAAALEYAMVVPEEGEQRAYLIGPNFMPILRYNCANKYAVSVGLLADAIVADGE